jgi:hypothetical protein
MYRINIANVRPWPLRLLILLTIGLPVVVNFPAYLFSNISPIELIAFWAGYASFIWLFILLNVGLKNLLNILSGAFILAITTAMLGAGTKKMFPFLAGGATVTDINIKMTTLFIIMISVIPYGLLFVNSFSSQGIIDNLSSRGKVSKIASIHIALGLRVLQHVGEVFNKLILVWSEEHPSYILPRFRKDWNGQWYKKINLLPWFFESIKSWIYACMMHTFEPIPVLVNEILRAANRII